MMAATCLASDETGHGEASSQESMGVDDRRMLEWAAAAWAKGSSAAVNRCDMERLAGTGEATMLKRKAGDDSDEQLTSSQGYAACHWRRAGALTQETAR